ncbi:hypothetical protein CHS0354_024470 [Potamilus streckersoni]|uniref:Uncharacterized protein n=1 Tax=Potamilus streckersoni TaxID=2493646 RepID=A0AAE0TL95_9BIVA|nr:hypothetical protein CHS0354_024470 [Potamilus streckersoni]
MFRVSSSYIFISLSFLCDVATGEYCNYFSSTGTRTMWCSTGCCGSHYDRRCCGYSLPGAIAGGILGIILLAGTIITITICFCPCIWCPLALMKRFSRTAKQEAGGPLITEGQQNYHAVI